MVLSRTDFNWKKEQEYAIKVKIERAITMVQGDNPNPDIAILHPEWVREAQNKKYTELTKSITDRVKKQQERAIARRIKVGRKD